MRIETAPPRERLATPVLMRRREFNGFIEGQFGREAVVDLPERARRGLDALAPM
jgi:hypothetical protein